MYYAIIDNDVIKEVRQISQEEFDQGIINKHQYVLDITDANLSSFFPASLQYLKDTINLLVSFGGATKEQIIAAIIEE